MAEEANRLVANLQQNSKIMRRRIIRTIVDVALFISVQVLMAVLHIGARPVWRGFFCDDETIRYRYSSDTVTVSMLLICLFVVIPITLIVVECCVTWRGRTGSTDVTSTLTSTSCWRQTAMSAVSVFCLFWFGFTVTMIVTEVGKLTVGRLRPHFIDVCRPNFSAINCSLGYIEQYACSNMSDSSKLLNARMSFPSGHSSMSTYAAVYLSFYVHRRLNSDYSVLCKYVVETLLCTAALFTCLSRVTDNMHHASDVVCGAAIGVIVAVWNVLLLQQHYRWARVTSSNDAGRLQVSAVPSSNNKRLNNDEEAETQLKTARDMETYFDIAIQ